MECQTSTTLLPWLVNASLEGEELSELEAHLTVCESCRRELEEVRLDFDLYDTHPSASMLAEMVTGELADSAAAVVQEHLDSCRRCRDEVAVMRESRRDLEAEFGPLEVGTARRYARSTGTGWRWAALAAGLAAIVATAGWLGGWLEPRIESDPAINVALLEVAPTGVVHRGEDAANELIVNENTGAVTLILISQQGEVFPEYEIELSDDSGAVLWRKWGLVRNPEGDYTISLPATSVPAGDLRVTVWAARDGRRVEVEKYEIRVQR